MSRAQRPRQALPLALLLLVTLSVLLGLLTLAERERATVSLHRLTPQGLWAESLSVAAGTDVYEQLLLRDTSTFWLRRQWYRLRKHGSLRLAHLSAEAGDLQAARRHLAAHLERHPFDLQAHWRFLEVTAAQGDHAAVVEAASALLSQRPAFGPALLRRARARQLAGEDLGSLHDFTAALDRPLLAEDFTAAAEGLLQLLVDRDEAETARLYATRLRQAVSLPRSELLLGYAAHALGEHAVAAKHFRLALEAQPSPDVTLALAQSLSLSGQEQEALELLLGRQFQGKQELERQRSLSRLAGKLGFEDLAIEAAAEALEAGEDYELRLELAQRLLDGSSADRGASERAWLLLSDEFQRPCTNGLSDAERCRQLAAEALWRLGRHQDLLALLRASLSDSSSIGFLERLALTLLESDPSEGALVFASLATLDEGAASTRHRLQAAEALLGAVQGDFRLPLLGGRDEEETLDARVYAAQQAGDWKKLRELLEELPTASDGLPRGDSHARTYCDALAALGSPDLLACLEKLARRHPADAELHYRLAGLHREAGALEPAAEWLQKATQLRAHPAWLLEQGFLLGRLDRPQEAEEVFRAAQAAGAGAEAELALAYSLMASGRRGAAAHHLRQAVAQAELPRDQRLPALDLLAQLLQEAGHPERAAEVLGQALQLEEDPERRLRLARALQQAGETAAADASLRQVDRDALDPDASLLWFDLAADLAAAREEVEAAVQLRQAAAAIAPPAPRPELPARALPA